VASRALPAAAVGNGWAIAATSGMLGLTTIAAWLSAAALSGRAWHAQIGLALVPGWAMAEIAGTPFGTIAQRSMSAFADVLPAAVAVLLLLKARRSPDVDASLRPLRTLALLLTAVVVVLLARSVAITVSYHASWATVISVGAFVATLWFVAAELSRRSHHLDPVGRRFTTLAFVAFALAAVDRTIGRLHTGAFPTPFTFSCARAVALVGWCLILVVAMRALGGARLAATARQRTLRAARDSVAQAFSEQRRRIAERRHDLRSLVAGIQGATTTLTRYRGLLDVGEQRRLESALLREIVRLQHALNPVPLQVRPFQLRPVVEAVLTAESARRGLIRWRLDEAEVLGNADATAAIVQNLITNCRRHAPDAAVTVIAETTGRGVVRLTVGDDGPGLPPLVRQRVEALFAAASIDRSTDGTTHQPAIADLAEGQTHGLGLTICARLAREQRLCLRLPPTTVGTSVVVEFADTRATAAAVVQPGAAR
jgi:signal transduction histidine kinase